MADTRAFIFDFFGVLVQYEDARVYRRLAPFCTDPAAAFVAMDDIGLGP